MPLYRVTFTTSLLVEAGFDRQAESIGYRHLADEVANGTSEVWSTEVIASESGLRRDEHRCLPWRHPSRRGDAEEDVNTILRRAVQEGEDQ